MLRSGFVDVALIIAAVVQALSAAVVAVATGLLTKRTHDLSDFTRAYVDEMKRSNDLIAEGNRITASSVAIAQGQSRPLLRVQQRGRSVGPTTAEAPLVVSNYGGGHASDVVVATSWGDGALRGVLPSGGEARVKVQVSREEWEGREDKDPVILRLRYRDSTSTAHDEEYQR